MAVSLVIRAAVLGSGRVPVAAGRGRTPAGPTVLHCTQPLLGRICCGPSGRALHAMLWRKGEAALDGGLVVRGMGRRVMLRCQPLEAFLPAPGVAVDVRVQCLASECAGLSKTLSRTLVNGADIVRWVVRCFVACGSGATVSQRVTSHEDLRGKGGAVFYHQRNLHLLWRILHVGATRLSPAGMRRWRSGSLMASSRRAEA